MMCRFYQTLSALCFAIAILSLAPSAHAAQGENCKIDPPEVDPRDCNKKCPDPAKPVCEVVGLPTGALACSGCKAESTT